MRSMCRLGLALSCAALTTFVAPAALVGAPGKKGTIRASDYYSGDKEALQLLKASDVVCRWKGKSVEMAITFVNRMDAHITIYVQPNYRIKRGGLHGDGLFSQEDVGVDAGARRRWIGDLGRPKGVTPGRPITHCGPEINSIELG